jgi:hypothetical protein
MNMSPTRTVIPTRPPSTFGRGDDIVDKSVGEANNKWKNFSKLGAIEQRNITKEYLSKKVKELKVKYQHQTDIASRI